MASVNTDLRSASASSAIIRTRRPHLARPQRRARADQLGQLGQRALGPLHLALVALEHDVVAAGHDADVELGLERAEVVVVAAEEVAQIDVGGERQSARDGGRFAQRLSFPAPESTTRSAAFGAQPTAPCALRRRLGQRQADVQLAQALGRHRRRRLHQEILRLLVHRERDDLADVASRRPAA